MDGAVAVYRDPDHRLHGDQNRAVLLAGLLVRHGRIGEAIEELRAFTELPGNWEDWIVGTLCDLYAEHGRAEDGLAHLDAMKERHGGQEDWETFGPRLALMAACGRIDEVAELACAHPEGDTWYAGWSLSELLAGAGRAEEALTVLERHPGCGTSLRAELLIDLGRIEEAVQVLQQRPQPEPADDPWVNTGICSTGPPF
ncbi:hypothetical protein [Kitasatospora griseola]|uniref:hypothetical protein n=1 Tax=Kitasatospora griseola TaxID=2064 RepID=UPI003808AD1A